MTGLFVIGTDTGVGKTTVAAGLARLALRRGRRPCPFKPVETGCDPDPLDAQLLWEAAGRPFALTEVCPFPLALPAAPAAAAQAAALDLDLDDLVRRAQAAASHGDFLLVEGAGGLLVPYAGALTAADLAARLRLPVLVVARTSLGTINHTALTLGELARRNIAVAGLVMVQVSAAAEPHARWNDDLITALTQVRAFGTLPYVGPAAARDPDVLASALEASLGPTTIARLLDAA